MVLTIAVPDARVPHVRAFERDWPAFETGAHTWRALVGIDLATPPRTYDLVVTAGS